MHLLANKTLTLVGDSITEQLFDGILESLTALHNYHISESIMDLDDSATLPGTTSKGKHLFKFVKVQETNTVLRYVKTFRFELETKPTRDLEVEFDPVRLVPLRWPETFRKSKLAASTFVVTQLQIEWLMATTHVLSFAAGLHYESKQKEFAQMINTLVPWFSTLNSKYKGQKLVFIRDALPAHQEGDMTTKLCGKHLSRDMDSLNTLMNSKIAEHTGTNENSLRVASLWNAYRDRHLIHVGIKEDKGKGASNITVWDCSHFCHSRYNMAPVVHSMYDIIKAGINVYEM